MGKLYLNVGFLLLLTVGACAKSVTRDLYHPELKPSNKESTVHQTAAGTDWNGIAQTDLYASLNTFPQIGVAKNVILFLGDGMGVSTVTAARHYLRQKRDLTHNDGVLAWDRFAFTGLSRTYGVDRMTPDSAGTASAFLCGEKANYYTLGVNDQVQEGNCTNVSGNKLKSALKHAMDKGKSTGIVTTARITHATPAAAYASVPHRDYEAGVPPEAIDPDQCVDIAYQLIHEESNQNFRVLLGGGRSKFHDGNWTDPVTDEPGEREDGQDLVQDWKNNMAANEVEARYLETRAELLDVKPEEVDYIFGLFNYDHMSYELDRVKESPPIEPSLTEMTQTAIEMLRTTTNGYFLLVEGARIDHAHHNGLAKKSLEETVSMSDAVDKALEMTSAQDTLIVVTADHSHVFTIAGYPMIDDDILGTTIDDGDMPIDGLPYTILGYTNGPGYMEHRENDTRMDLTGVNTTTDDYVMDAGIPMSSETHAGEDVAIFASGPMAYLLNGVHEQHYIAHAMMYASCIGTNQKHCSEAWPHPDYPVNPNSAGLFSAGLLLTLMLSILTFAHIL